MDGYDRSFIENWRQDLHAEGQYLREEIDKLCELALKGLDEQKSVEAALAADREAALRDVFAAAALSGYIACDAQEVCRNDGSRFGRPITADDLAELAYEQADAMLKARKC